MKFGYLRKDDDGHDYVIPEELIEEFDADWEVIQNAQSYHQQQQLIEQWNETWWDYAEGGSVSHYKVVMEE